MIIVKIFQGPGNQLFQIAFGLAAANRLNTELKLDLSWYKDNSWHRKYILDKFNIDAPVATEKEIYDVLTCNASNFLAYKWNQLNRLYLRPYYQRPKIVEPWDKFDLNYTKIIDSTYVQGYFASRDFFIDQLDYVRQQLRFKLPPSDQNKALIAKIKSENAVAISFRLGDFLAKPYHNVCSIQYYQRCIDYLMQRYENLKFYVFSDDLNWVRENFKSQGNWQYMDFNGADYMEDFRLLTNFKYHIIPNSTFSWWGALLSETKDKVVLAPEYWLHPDKSLYREVFGDMVLDATSVVPTEWIRIANMVDGDTYIK